MSRIELDAIQIKLKTAIQNHQILVKTKGDQQNVAFKSCLKELQEEIKRLSEEQKKIVVKLRESLVKSSSQSPPSHQQQQPSKTTTAAAVGGSVVGGEMSTVLDPQTVSAAIGQSRLVYPTAQGGAILPVGMVALPLAHIQRPTLGVTFNAGQGQICTPAGNITLQPGNYANAIVAAAAAASQIPSGLQASGPSINIPINSGMNNTNTNIALQNSIAINNITNAINVSTLNGNLVNGSINITRLANPNATPAAAAVNNNLNAIIGSTGMTAHSLGGIVIGSKALAQLNNNNVALTTVVNSQGAVAANVTPSTTTNQIGTIAVSQSNIFSVGSGIPISSSNQIITSLANGSNSQTAVAVTSPPMIYSSSTPRVSASATSHVQSSLPTVVTAKDKITILPSQIPQQQSHLKVQSPLTVQQNVTTTSTNSPIKVPQYTVFPVRTTYCSIAPAPSPASTVSAMQQQQQQPVTTTSAITLNTACVKKPEAVVKPSPSSKTSTLSIPSSLINKGKGTVTPTKAVSSPQEEMSITTASTVKSLSEEDNRKHQFMKALDLYAPDMLQDLLYKRNERKRRTTANPNYSIGFQSNRWQRKEMISATNPFKKAKVGKERKPAPKPYPGKEEKMSDNHDDFCAACGKGGQLLMCETCRLVYHLDCLKPPLTEAPNYAWSCPKCLVSGKGSANLNSEALSRVHAYIGKRLAKEDERKKLQRKGAEIRNEKAFLDGRSKKLETDMKDQTDSKKRLKDKETASKKELDQLSVLIQSVRENHSTVVSPTSIMGASKLHDAVSSSPQVANHKDTPFSKVLPPSSSCSAITIVPLSTISVSSESQCKDLDKSIDKENQSLTQQEDPSSTISSSSVVGDDRIVLEFKVSAKEFCEIENNSSRNAASSVEMMETDSPETAKAEVGAKAPSVVESSIAPVSSSIPATPPPSSPTVLNSCGESLKQGGVKPDQQQQQLPISL